MQKEKSFVPAESPRVRDRPSKNSRSEQRHRGPDPYKACNTKPQNASLSIHVANIDPSYCNTFSPPSVLSLHVATTLLSAIILRAPMSIFSARGLLFCSRQEPTNYSVLLRPSCVCDIWSGSISSQSQLFGLKEPKQQVLANRRGEPFFFKSRPGIFRNTSQTNTHWDVCALTWHQTLGCKCWKRLKKRSLKGKSVCHSASLTDEILMTFVSHVECLQSQQK